MKLYRFEVGYIMYCGAVWAEDEQDAEQRVYDAMNEDDIEHCYCELDGVVHILNELPKEDASRRTVLNPGDEDEDYEEEE